MGEGSRTVTAAVTDPAGNTSTATEQLTVDTVAPAVTITGGATALTDDPSPTITGTTDAPLGAVVTVTLADQTLTGTVQSDGTWSVTSAHLADGPHLVVMTVSDAAGNQASAVQTLTVNTVAPLVTIMGGPSASTSSTSPTLSGSTDASPGSTMTVTVAGQTLTALVQPDGSWNATFLAVGVGAWQAVATVTNDAGDVGSATQTLTITAAAASGGTGATGPVGATGPTGADGLNWRYGPDRCHGLDRRDRLERAGGQHRCDGRYRGSRRDGPLAVDRQVVCEAGQTRAAESRAEPCREGHGRSHAREEGSGHDGRCPPWRWSLRPHLERENPPDVRASRHVHDRGQRGHRFRRFRQRQSAVAIHMSSR